MTSKTYEKINIGIEGKKVVTTLYNHMFKLNAQSK